MLNAAAIDGRSAKTGRVLDLSHGGAAIELTGWSGLEEIEMSVAWLDQRCRLRGTVIASQPSLFGALLHVQFASLNDGQREFVERVILASRVDFEAWQQYLSSRPNGFSTLRRRQVVAGP